MRLAKLVQADYGTFLDGKLQTLSLSCKFSLYMCSSSSSPIPPHPMFASVRLPSEHVSCSDDSEKRIDEWLGIKSIDGL